LIEDDEVDDAELQDVLAWRRVHCNGDASVAMAMVVFGGVFLLGSLQRRKKGSGGEWRRRQGERLGFAGALEFGI
jgi:hypothetical protein